MRGTPIMYARAFTEACEEVPAARRSALAAEFVAVVRRHGDGAKLSKILVLVEGMVVRSGGGHMIRLETARACSPQLRDRLKKIFGAKDRITERLRPEILAGIRVVVDGEREFDGSLKRKLDKLLA